MAAELLATLRCAIGTDRAQTPSRLHYCKGQSRHCNVHGGRLRHNNIHQWQNCFDGKLRDVDGAPIPTLRTAFFLHVQSPRLSMEEIEAAVSSRLKPVVRAKSPGRCSPDEQSLVQIQEALSVQDPYDEVRSVEQLNVLRRRAVKLRKATQAPFRQIASTCGLSLTTVTSAWDAYERGGWSMVDVPKGGRPEGSGRRLTLVQEAKAAMVILGTSPAEFGLPAQTWTAELVQRMLKSVFGLELPRTTLSDYLSTWGLEFEPPWVAMARERPEYFAVWKTEIRRRLIREAKLTSATMLWTGQLQLKRSTLPSAVARQIAAHHKSRSLAAPRGWSVFYSMTSRRKAYWLSFPGQMDNADVRECFEKLSKAVGGAIFLMTDSNDFGYSVSGWKRQADRFKDIRVIDFSDPALLYN